ncbi:hypothetical protein [Sinorhizobium meliloti]|uniref:hypothetical protein n=1 Tax=Rhizobium meliloti TaxID=382 RepID=UPI0001E4AB47|nr:hypothetical protein [Sinorhizobium meliloti]AEG53124.1 hypothetical protein Sinme_1377 [Sinorhizobium meliloti AK83]MDE4591162.1 hypothetical protein [Sinorhizobium meliloti]SEI55664.1 hypothetical protein SAMN04244575_01025 [Sinorhizobium meliloti]
MAELPLDQAIPRFKANEDRVDRFTNGNDTATWTTSDGAVSPSLRKYLKDKDAEINGAGNLILSGAQAAANTATTMAGEATAARDVAVSARDEAVSVAYTRFNTEADFEASTAIADIVQVLGYYSAGDQGSHRKVRRTGPLAPQPWLKFVNGAWWEINEPTLNPYMFGAIGNGAADDYPPLRDTFLAAAALKARVHIPEGVFRQTSGSAQVFSYTIVTGEGVGRSIIVQPNYYSYDRPTAPYVKENVVDWNGLWMDVGTRCVSISGLEFRGPFWQADEAAYVANPVQSWPASNGIHVRGADYQFRKGLPIEGESVDIRIRDCHFEGWGEDAVQTDMVTHVYVEHNTMGHNARGGHRGYSCVHAWTQFNSIYSPGPGDYLNNGNRMYGVEYTRQYIAGVRPSTDFWVAFNRVNGFIQWKGMGTHGGVRGNFLFNDIFDCHHGIGIDKGGFTEEHGISPPRDIKIIGNRCYRSAPGNPTEGNGEGGAGHGVFVVAHDNTAAHMGRNIVIADNIFEGWGSENLEGGAWIGNWDGVSIHGNTWRNSFGSGVRFRDKVTGLNMGPNIFIGVNRSSEGNQRAIGVENAQVYGTIAPQYFENTDTVNTATFLFLSNHGANEGLTVADGHRFVGLVSKTNIALNALPSPFNLTPVAGGYAAVSVGAVTPQNVTGATLVWESTGVVLATVDRPATLANNLFAIPGVVGSGGRTINWERVGTNQIRFRTFTAGGSTPVDNSFSFAIFAM